MNTKTKRIMAVIFAFVLALPILLAFACKKSDEDSVSQEEYNQVAEKLIEAGYKVKGKGFDANPDGKVLRQNFWILGASVASHPAYAMMLNATEILNKLGQETKVEPNPNGMELLGNGGQLGVWAAAWTLGTDPDMTQVYSKDSQATSVLNWGFGREGYEFPNGSKGILANQPQPAEGEEYHREWQMVNELSQFIAQGRTTVNQNQRKQIYERALDKVMDLAVEMPIYQNKILKFWDKNVLDRSTFTPNASDFIDYLDNLWNVSFVNPSDNDTKVLTLPTSVLDSQMDGGFHPFNATNGNAVNVLKRMLLPLVGIDETGTPKVGMDVNSIALDLKEETELGDGNDYKITFVLKDSVKWQTGKPVTVKDVLFSYQVSLDTNYTGGNTLYRSPIKGLDEFRNGTVDYIEGLKIVTDDVTIDGKKYPKAEYDANGQLTSGYEAFSIELDSVDATLIANSNFLIASMDQYSPQAETNGLFDANAGKYGTKPGDRTFFQTMYGMIDPPVASGAYQAANSSFNPTQNVNQFYNSGIAQLVANPYFGTSGDSNDIMQPAKIKKVAIREGVGSQIYDELDRGVYHYANVVAQQNGILEAVQADTDLILETTNRYAYGYMGINAAFIPELEARQAIMLACDRNLAMNSFPAGYASLVNRSSSTISWAYPEGAEDRYPYIPKN